MRPLTLLGCVAIVALSSTAFAQNDEAKAQAVQRYEEGNALHLAGKDEDAYVRFAQAYAVLQTPPILFDLARSEHLTKRWIESARHYREYLAHPPHPKITPEMQVKASAYLLEVNQSIGHLAITAPDGARIKVDGKEVGVAPLREAIDVAIGLHGVDCDSGGTTVHESVQAPGGGKLTAVAFLGGVVGDPHVVGGGVTPPPGGEVGPLPPGHVEPVHQGYWTGRRKVGVVIAGVGVVGMVVGAVFGVERGSETTDATNAAAMVGAGNSGCFHSTSAACNALGSALNSNGTDATVETAFLVGGGVLVAVGLLTTLWPSASQASTAGLVPSVGPHVAGFQWNGSF